MTLWGIDISQWQAGIDLQRVRDEGFEFVIARVGQGAGGKYGTTRDIEWIRHRDEANRLGLVLCAYWYVGDGISPDENAKLCASWMEDTSIPVILDCEDGSGDVNHFHATLDAFMARGMYVPLSYIPHWYWNNLGSPSLAGLPPLWASRYVNGSGYASNLYPGDNSDFWSGYGGNAVELLQFTNSAFVAGYHVDADAFRGTREQFINVVGKPSLGNGVPMSGPLQDWESRRLLERILSMSEGVEGQNFDGDQFKREQAWRDSVDAKLAQIMSKLGI